MTIQLFLESYIQKNFSLKILEIGPGKNPSTNEYSLEHQTYSVDNEVQKSSDIHTQHYYGNFLNTEFEVKFDLIIDRLTFHEQCLNQRHLYLNKIHKNLTDNGKFICEHAIYHKNLMFFEDDLLYDDSTNLLYQQKANKTEMVKCIPPAREIEGLLIMNHFNILEFTCDPSKKIICNRADTNTKASDPDHLFFCVEKKLN